MSTVLVRHKGAMYAVECHGNQLTKEEYEAAIKRIDAENEHLDGQRIGYAREISRRELCFLTPEQQYRLIKEEVEWIRDSINIRARAAGCTVGPVELNVAELPSGNTRVSGWAVATKKK